MKKISLAETFDLDLYRRLGEKYAATGIYEMTLQLRASIDSSDWCLRRLCELARFDVQAFAGILDREKRIVARERETRTHSSHSNSAVHWTSHVLQEAEVEDRKNILGSTENLESVTVEKLASFHTEMLSRSRRILLVSDNLKAALIDDLARTYPHVSFMIAAGNSNHMHSLSRAELYDDFPAYLFEYIPLNHATAALAVTVGPVATIPKSAAQRDCSRRAPKKRDSAHRANTISPEPSPETALTTT